MHCPFCPGVLEGDLSDLGEGETGGAAAFWHLHCASCQAKLRRLRVDKVFDAMEDWALERAPTLERAEGSGWVCPRCEGRVRGAIPPDAEVQPPWSGEDHPAQLELRVDAICGRCSARFDRVVRSDFDGGGRLIGSDETWYSIEQQGNTQIARPLPALLKAISGA